MRARIKEGWFPYGVGFIVDLIKMTNYQDLFEISNVVEGDRKNYELCKKKLIGKHIHRADLDFNYTNMKDTTKTFRVKIKDNHPNPLLKGVVVNVSLDERLDIGDRYKLQSIEKSEGDLSFDITDTYYIMDEYLDYDPKDIDETDYLLSTEANKENLTKSIENAEKGNVRQFDGGAIRDTEDNKEDYVETISYLFLKRFAEYMTSKATKYGRGNWRKGIPIDSAERSYMRHNQKYFANKYDNANLEPNEDHLMAACFNLMLIAHEEEKLKIK